MNVALEITKVVATAIVSLARENVFVGRRCQQEPRRHGSGCG